MNHRSVLQRSPSGKPKQNMKPVGYVLCLFHVLVNCNNLCQSVSICHTNFRIVDCEALSLPSFPTTKTTKNAIKYRKIQEETWAKSKNYEETCSKTALATFSLAFFLGSTNYTFLYISRFLMFFQQDDLPGLRRTRASFFGNGCHNTLTKRLS